MNPADLTRIWRKTLRAEAKGIPSRHKRAVMSTPKILDEPHINTLVEATLLERAVLDEALRQMRTWTPEEIIEILQEAATMLVTLRAEVWCDWCDGPVVEPVRDGEAVSWLGKGASTFCSQTCLDAHDESRINAAGNEAS